MTMPRQPRTARQPNTLGDRLYTSRLRAKMTQEQVAQRVGISRASVATWETNTCRPNAESLTKLGGLFGVSPAYLQFGDGTAPTSDSGFDAALQSIRACRWTGPEAAALKAMIDVQVVG